MIGLDQEFRRTILDIRRDRTGSGITGKQVEGTMKKIAVLSFLFILFTVTIIANNPLASEQATAAEQIPVDLLKSNTPLPSPSTLLLIGSGLIALIIYRKKFKEER
jgi:hypothetical protein